MKNFLSAREKILPFARNLGLRIFRLAALFYICLFLFTLFAANPLIFPSPPPTYTHLPGQITLHTQDNLQLAALWRPQSGAAQTILYSHGNGEDLGLCQPRLDLLAGFGFNIFAYDYRGYGRSDGKPGEQGVYLDIQAAWNYLVNELQLPPKTILIYGRSLGSGPSTWLASRQDCAGLILESAYTSTFKTTLPWLWFPNDKFPNLSRMKQIHCPVLVMHGSEDPIIPFSHGQRLFQAAAEPKLSLWVKGAGHNDLSDLAEKDYEKAILDLAKAAKNNAHQPSK